MTKLAKYPPHLFVVEYHIAPDLVLPRQYPSEAAALLDIRSVTPYMNRSQGAIIRLRLWHKGELRGTYGPNAPTPRALPLPDHNGVRHLPPVTRAIKPSSIRFNSASPVAPADCPLI